MAGFRKAQGQQAALKMGLYGPAGSGKTLTSMLIAEGLAKLDQKRFAYVDTEHGTDFYSQHVATRPVHPEAFDFDALYTRAITEVNRDLRSLDPTIYSAVVIDSMTHLWEACREAAQRARITKAVRPHLLRHYAASRTMRRVIKTKCSKALRIRGCLRTSRSTCGIVRRRGIRVV